MALTREQVAVALAGVWYRVDGITEVGAGAWSM
jgi:hypothetical protein